MNRYAVIIEIADDDPRVVTFEREAEAQDFRDRYEAATEGAWDSDPQWNHYPRDPIWIIAPEQALGLLRRDVEFEKANRPDES